MKKLVLALTAVAAFTAPALAADMAPRAYSKAPAPVAYAPSWTGCYVGGGGGYGLWNQENTAFADPPLGGFPVRTLVSGTSTAGGRGYFGTVQGGCDYQFGLGSYNLVVGAFGDYDFSSLKGHLNPPGTNLFGDEKMSSAWSVGGRVGWLVVPSLLTYFSGGYTEARFDRIDFIATNGINTIPSGQFLAERTYKGWFLGAGDEYALNFLPGLFWKTEYRFSHYDKTTNPSLAVTTGLPIGFSFDSEKWVHTVRSELVYRFNWGGAPIAARY
jgi:outer membrane immunogenic protein